MRALMIGLTVACFVCINTFALPLIAWLTFGGTEEWAILWKVGAVLVALLVNAGVIQMTYSIWKKQTKFFWIGLVLTVIEIAMFGAIAFYITSDSWAIGVILLTAICALALLIYEIRATRKKSQDPQS